MTTSHIQKINNTGSRIRNQYSSNAAMLSYSQTRSRPSVEPSKSSTIKIKNLKKSSFGCSKISISSAVQFEPSVDIDLTSVEAEKGNFDFE